MRERKGLKVCTRVGSVRLQVGQPLTGDHWNKPHEAEVVKGLAVLEVEKIRNMIHATRLQEGLVARTQ